MVLSIAFFGLLFSVLLFMYDKIKDGSLNYPNEEKDYDFTEDSEDAYRTNINPAFNSSVGKSSHADKDSFMHIYRNSSFFQNTLEDDEDKEGDYDKMFKV